VLQTANKGKISSNTSAKYEFDCELIAADELDIPTRGYNHPQIEYGDYSKNPLIGQFYRLSILACSFLSPK
jgi:hypothetical protein